MPESKTDVSNILFRHFQNVATSNLCAKLVIVESFSDPQKMFTLGLECLCHIYNHKDSFESSPRGPNPGEKEGQVEMGPSVQLQILFPEF